MASDLSLGFPTGTADQEKAILVAGVVLVVAVTPTLFDAYDAWQKHPNVRVALVLWYLFVAGVSLSAWQVFLGGKR